MSTTSEQRPHIEPTMPYGLYIGHINRKLGKIARLEKVITEVRAEIEALEAEAEVARLRALLAERNHAA